MHERVLLEKPVVAQLAAKFFFFYGTRMLINVFAKSSPLVLILRYINILHTLALYIFKYIF
jgi:hypothetical protein